MTDHDFDEVYEEPRYTLAHDRFQVGNGYCGLLASFSNMQDAKDYAKRWLQDNKHDDVGDQVEIFDAMAHYDYPELYKYRLSSGGYRLELIGKVIKRRES
jgi:hypothetical protein